MATAWMSWWDTYLAPGDIRARRQQSARTQQDGLAPKLPPRTLIRVERIDPAARARRQNALLFGGIGLMCLSFVVTRRAVARKQAVSNPKTFTPSTAAAEINAKGGGALDALHALNLATLNIMGVFITAAGVGAKYFDVADHVELRDKLRSGLGFDEDESEADHEIEGWIAGVLARKDGQGNLREGVAEAIAKIQEQEKAEEKRRKG